MLNVACVKVGSRYDARYVNTLYDMVSRNLAAGFHGRFVCFTDDATGLDPAIHVREVPKELHERGWWAKLYLFSKDAFPEGDRVLYFDLDTVVCGPLDEIVKYEGKFAILRDAYRPDGWQSSVMAWEAGAVTWIWDYWVAAGKPNVDGGDQAWIEKHLASAHILQDLYPGRLRSYKVDCRMQIPRGTSVVFFHGNPRPHEVSMGWVPEVWKIGGGSGLEWIVTANVSEDNLRANARSAIERDCEWLKVHPEHKETALIVGGGPSLKDSLFYIRGMQMAGCHVYACGNAYKYLEANGIQPDAHVLLDARAENIEFVPEGDAPKYYASQCHPSVLDKAGPALICWHAALTGYEDAFRDHYSAELRIGGGTTVGLKALAITYALGYRDMRLFGFDSSYEESHHAYEQKLNDGERVIEAKVMGETFRAAPWMVAQTEEFKDLMPLMTKMGCTVRIFGRGLLSKVAEQLSYTAADQRAEVILKRLEGISDPKGAEIGVYLGALSKRLLARPDLSLYMVDCWAAQRDEVDGLGDFHATMTQKDHDDAYEMACKGAAFAGERAVILRMWSKEAAQTVADESLDFVFIDADHSYEGCKGDIEAWASKVKPGGWLMGHDYENPEFPLWGVERAVKEYAETIGAQIELDDNYTWFMRLPERATRLGRAA